MTIRKSTAGLIVALCLAASSAAEPTEITVHVISKGAKFIGSSMGGVSITLRDARTGELLAQGTTQGTTGDTEKIMEEKHGRGDALSTRQAASYTATLELEEPRLIEVTAYGPLAQRQSAGRVSATQWVVPGRHINQGDGWLLQMPGLIVDALAPPAHIKLPGAQTIKLHANVTMMCGCPITPDGLWDADRFEIRAVVRRDGKRVAELPMRYAGTPSQFRVEYEAAEPGVYDALIYAHQPSNGNTGLDRTTWIIAPSEGQDYGSSSRNSG